MRRQTRAINSLILVKILEEFKAFIARGNVIDLAVGVIIGGAFGKIVSSLVNDIVMPPIGLLLANVNFNNLFISLNGKTYPTLAAAREQGAPVLAYGAFLNAVVEFFIVAACIFLVVKTINKLHAAAPKPAPEPPRSERLLEEIRDDGCRVLTHRTSLTPLRKLWIAWKTWARRQ